MLRRTASSLAPSGKGIGGKYSNWPWPVQLPFKKNWFPQLSRNESIAADTRQVLVAGDCAVVLVLGYAAYKLYSSHTSGQQQTRLKHLTNYPPAIIAQEFDFANSANNRKVERKVLDEYRQRFAEARTTGDAVESFIFNY